MVVALFQQPKLKLSVWTIRQGC